LNLSALLGSRRIYLLILGEDKWRTFTAATGPGPIDDMPVRGVLRQQHTPVEVAWAP
jgi:6-phosphogluconolactonase